LLGAVDQRLNEALLLLDQDGPAAIKYLAEAAGRLAGHDDMSEAIADGAMRAADLCPGGLRRLPAPSSRPLLEALRRSYTMDAERRIHDGFAPDTAGPKVRRG
jgi:hypothetical protein